VSKKNGIEAGLIGERVSIVTSAHTTLSDPHSGEFIEVPLVYEGTVMDIDDACVIVEPFNGEPFRIVYRHSIVSFELLPEDMEPVGPNTPNREDMN